MWGIARCGNEPPSHVYAGEHEIYYMLEGEVEIFCAVCTWAFAQ